MSIIWDDLSVDMGYEPAAWVWAHLSRSVGDDSKEFSVTRQPIRLGGEQLTTIRDYLFWEEFWKENK